MDSNSKNKTYKIYITQTLQRELEVEAESKEEALNKIEEKFNNGELLLDYDDVIDTEFSNCKLSKKEIDIFDLTEQYCKNHCDKNCVYDNCIFFKIKNLIEA